MPDASTAAALAIEHDADLQACTTLRVPARARVLATLSNESALPAVADLVQREGRLPLVLGGGSNLLLTRDPDVPVLRMALRGIRVAADAGPDSGLGGEDVLVDAAAGESWDGLVRTSLAAGLCGLENLALIWGSVGASPVQNIGAYGVELRERFESLRAVELATGRVRRFDAADCAFGYRDSVFKHDAGRGWMVLSVRLRLSRRCTPRLDYGELRTELSARGAQAGGDAASAVAIAEAVSAIRRRKLPDPATLPNAGSFFKNPVVACGVAQALRDRFPGLPAHAVHAVGGAGSAGAAGAVEGAAKLSAGWLIEHAGYKAARRGDAGVAAHHALVLVNHGHATGGELLALAREIQAGVLQRFGVALEPEPVIV